MTTERLEQRPPEVATMWEQVRAQSSDVRSRTLREMFATDPGRGTEFVVQAGDLVIDYSFNLIDRRSLALMRSFARHVGLEEHRAKMFKGGRINNTEDRAVLHTALRRPPGSSAILDGHDVMPDIRRELQRMGDFTDDVRSGQWRGATGEVITTIVNLGIGGSDLGPKMACRALRAYNSAGLDVRFVSNIDPADLLNTLQGLSPTKTMFIVASKTFTTIETLANAAAARAWVTAELGEDAVKRHFVAVSTNAELVSQFGIDVRNMFGFWDWVGGRYSVASSIGLAVMAAIGRGAFEEFLEGMHTIDRHFEQAPLKTNAPAILGMLSFWYTNVFDAQTRAILPYSNDLEHLPAYLQQLAMESNGKSVHRDGSAAENKTSAIWWGQPGTNGQHAFYQLLHQGTWLVPADFIGFAQPAEDLLCADNQSSMHDALFSNLLAQRRVLAFGRTASELSTDGTPEDLVSHKVMPGNRPSTTILAPRLTPSTLGQLIALYEHQVFTEGVLAEINSFDQWGVELGKVQALSLQDAVSGRANLMESDSSTSAVLNWYRATNSILK